MGAYKECYCAFCRNPRKIYRKKRADFFNALQALGIATIASFMFWGNLNPKGLLIAIIVFMFIDFVIIFRGRVGLTCPHCGFDPILYMRSQSAACEKVKKHIEGRQNDPDVWLARRPPIVIPKLKKNGKSTREIVI